MGTRLSKLSSSRYKPARKTASRIRQPPCRSSDNHNTTICGQLNAQNVADRRRRGLQTRTRLEVPRKRGWQDNVHLTLNWNLLQQQPQSVAAAEGCPVTTQKERTQIVDNYHPKPSKGEAPEIKPQPMSVPGMSQGLAVSNQKTHHKHPKHKKTGTDMRKGPKATRPKAPVTADERPERALPLPGLENSDRAKDLRRVNHEADSSPHQTKSRPIKSTGDLFPAAKGFEYNDETELPPVLTDLILSHSGRSIIPAIVESYLESVLDKNEVVYPWMIDQDSSITDREEALRELSEIQSILHESRHCNREGASEAAWKDGVTSRVLFLAMRQAQGVRHHNITVAQMESSLIPKDVRGGRLGSKAVDYSINLLTQQDTVDDGDVEDGLGGSIRELLACVPRERATINQTMYGPVRFNPAGVSIETKSKWASDGRAQLSVWIAAWLQQMRYLRAVSADPEGNAWESSEIYKQPINMKMPLIAATKGMWHLYLATDRRDKIVISSLFSIGDTDSLVGIYNLIKSLRILALWVNGPFREFMRTQVLQTSSNAANI